MRGGRGGRPGPLCVLGRAVRLRCPRCGAEPLFGGWFAMPPACRACGLRYERAQGYWVGAIYVNYGLTAVIVIGGYFLLWWATALPLAAHLALWGGLAVVLPLLFFRWSRSLWLALEWFVNPEE